MREQRPSNRRGRSENVSPAPPSHDHLYVHRSEPQERALTAILQLGEELAAPLYEDHEVGPVVEHAVSAQSAGRSRPDEIGELPGLIRLALEALHRDAAGRRLVELMPEMFGDGDSLRLIFGNLFPGVVRPRIPDEPEGALLTPREVEILDLAARDRTVEEMAGTLSISRGTIHTHFKHIYRKLGTHRPLQAVARAAALGYLPLNALTLFVEAARVHTRGAGLFESYCAACAEPPLDAPEMWTLGALGLLLITVSSAASHQIHSDTRHRPSERGGVCAIDRDGHATEPFPGLQMGIARHVVIAPRHAQRAGFTPGRLFVAHDLTAQQGLNQAAITELTPEGRFVRSFCGAPELGTRLIGPVRMVFDDSGRLLVTSGWLTDSILCFDDGGRRVRRFADGAFTALCVSSHRVYACQWHELRSVIKVFDASGDLLETLAASEGPANDCDIAASSKGDIFLNRDQNGDRCLEVYGPEGDLQRILPLEGRGSRLLAIDREDRLYVQCWRTGGLLILSKWAEVLGKINLRGHVTPHSACMAENGRIWVCGQIG